MLCRHKVFQGGLSKFINRGNRKFVPFGMLLYITVFFFFFWDIIYYVIVLLVLTGEKDHLGYGTLTYCRGLWVFVYARNIEELFLHFWIIRVKMHTSFLTSDHKLYWMWILESKRRCDFRQNLPILFQFKAINLCQQLVWQTKLT